MATLETQKIFKIPEELMKECTIVEKPNKIIKIGFKNNEVVVVNWQDFKDDLDEKNYEEIKKIILKYLDDAKNFVKK